MCFVALDTEAKAQFVVRGDCGPVDESFISIFPDHSLAIPDLEVSFSGLADTQGQMEPSVCAVPLIVNSEGPALRGIAKNLSVPVEKAVDVIAESKKLLPAFCFSFLLLEKELYGQVAWLVQFAARREWEVGGNSLLKRKVGDRRVHSGLATKLSCGLLVVTEERLARHRSEDLLAESNRRADRVE